MERWKLNLYTIWISQIISLMSFGFGLPFLPLFAQSLGVTDPDQLKIITGVLSSAPAITMAVMSPIWGVLSDRYGQKVMLQRATFAAIFIMAGLGMSTTVWQLIVFRLLQGVFTGTVTAASTFVAVNTPNDKLSYALGFLSSSTFIGYSVGPMIGGKVAELYGYRVSFLVGAGLMVLGFLIVTFFLKPVKEKAYVQAKPFSGRSEWRIIFNHVTIIMMLMLFVQRITRTVFQPFLPLYILEIMPNAKSVEATTGYISGLIGFVTAVSAIVVGRMSDRRDKIKIIRVILILSFLDVLVLNFSHGFAAFVVFYSLLFLIIGGLEPLITAISAEQTPPEKRGALFGMQGLVGSIGWTISPLIGTLISVRYDLSYILWILLGLVGVNLAVSYFYRRHIAKHEMHGNA